MLDDFRKSARLKELKLHHRVLSGVVIFLGVVMLWRGAWGLMDMFLLPDHPLISHLISLVAGGLVLYISDFNIDDLRR